MLDLTETGSPVGDAPVAGVLAQVREQLAELVAGQRPDSAWEARHFVSRGARTVSRRLFVEVLFEDRPVWIAKVPLNPADTMVDREWEILAGRNWTRPVFETPVPLARLPRGFVMSWVPQADFPEALSTAGTGAPALLTRATDAVAALHGDGRHSDARELVEDFLGPGFHELPESVVTLLERSRTGLFHGDLGPWNLRVSDEGALGLIDWEDCREQGVQAVDVLNLGMTSVLAADSGYQSRTMDSLVDEMLDPASPMGAAIVASLRRYARSTDQCVRDVGALVPLFCLWMEERIRRQGRATSHLFYAPLRARFARDGHRWIQELGR
ncbi:phosphotransferase [Streptomyces sp. NPDC050388]|uniref:phosphotransferase n=1 Tax=Streptomyces sp. NPDC050388 TaxID=3155781 RepID=UPI003413ED54